MEFKKLSIADKEIIKPFFADVFTKEPWNDDWSDATQLDGCTFNGLHQALVPRN